MNCPNCKSQDDEGQALNKDWYYWGEVDGTSHVFGRGIRQSALCGIVPSSKPEAR